MRALACVGCLLLSAPGPVTDRAEPFLVHPRHVLDTWESGGGSGIFRSLLFVRLERERVIDGDGLRDRVVMRCVGEYGLGDRDDRDVELVRDRVIVGASRDRAAMSILLDGM